MEFYNEKLLTKGLPEIIVQFVPEDIYPITKVIAHPHKKKKGLHGQAGFCSETNTYNIHLWPTTICFAPEGEGTYSFRLWKSLLRVALHEVGHLVTHDIADAVSEDEYNQHGEAYSLVEKVANDFAERSMIRIGEVDPRLGQPVGALTGYAGILAYKRRQGNFEGFDMGRITEWRAMKCNAQIPISVVIRQLVREFDIYRYGYDYKVLYPITARIIHTQTKQLGIDRYFINRIGRKYLMFNYREALQIIAKCSPIIRQMHIILSLQKLYKQYGNQSEVEKDKETLIWEGIVQNNIFNEIQKPFEIEGMSNAKILPSVEPDDVPF